MLDISLCEHIEKIPESKTLAVELLDPVYIHGEGSRGRQVTAHRWGPALLSGQSKALSALLCSAQHAVRPSLM